MLEKEFLFTVIVTVYNVEAYLHETVQSVLQQSVGFQDNIQLILVDNGSTDRSYEICKEYQEEYSNNIDLIRVDDNLGICGGRNAGIPYIRGKLVNFMDSDDKWDIDAFRQVREFYEDNNEKLEVICCREKTFDAYEKWHIFDYIYSSDHICSIHEDYDCTIFAAHASFVKCDLLFKYQFIEELTSAEDMLFMNSILLDVEQYGVMRTAVYHYRQRTNGSSTVQTYHLNRRWYLEDFEIVTSELVDHSIANFGRVIPIVQSVLMGKLVSHIKCRTNLGFLKEGRDLYYNNINHVLQYIDDDIIYSNKHINLSQKVNLFSIKYGKDIYKNSNYRKGKLYFNNIMTFSIVSKERILIDSIEVKESSLLLGGIVHNPINNLTIFLKDEESHKYDLKLSVASDNNAIYCFDKAIEIKYFFTVSIPLVRIDKLHFECEYENHNIRMNFTLGLHAKISSKLKNDYYYKNGYMISKKGDAYLCIEKVTDKQRRIRECTLLKEMNKQKLYKAILCRVMSILYKKLFKRKQIWLITDRIMSADDCGEYFFRYLSTIENPNIKAYFVLSKECSDWNRIKKYGNVVAYRSTKHKILFLFADKIISSLVNDWVLDCLHSLDPYIRSIRDYKFVHIQHGVIKDDLSSELNCLKKNIKLFVTSARSEQQSIINSSYGYDESVVKITGLPRYDCMTSTVDRGDCLIIAPTWRQYLVGKKDPHRDRYIYNDSFKKSSFYIFYSKLISDKRILGALKKNRMKGILRLHPMFQAQACDFESNEIFTVEYEKVGYEEDIKRCALIVTDYSSIAFDYAYFGRPVIYTQFDSDEFYMHHTYKKGYFDYEKDGFGCLCQDYESTVNAIINSLNNGCKLEEIYKKRIDHFFGYHDNKNCERLYKEICSL